jgi:tetratricopeptide (TPR) repeat protein
MLQSYFSFILDRQRQEYQLANQLFLVQDTGPSAALVLAVRAGRRAVAANPEDANAYRELGLAYRRLWENQEVLSHYSRLQQLRQIQAVTAFQNALTLNPDDLSVHYNLAMIYQQSYVELFWRINSRAESATSFIDLEIDHRREYLRLVRAAGPLTVVSPDGSETRKETPDEFAKRMESLERNLKQREKEVDFQGRLDDYERKAANKAPLEKAKMAVANGLVKHALEVLRELPAPLAPEARDLAISLYLATGQVAVLLEPDTPLDDWTNIFLAAAVGDYHKADTILDQILHTRETEFMGSLLHGVRSQLFMANLNPLGLRQMIEVPSLYTDQANEWVFWGLLAVEEGDNDRGS